MSLIRVKNLSITFSHPTQRDFQAVKNVSFSLNEGETLAIVGESGSGKSVSALSLLGLLPQSATITGERFYQDNALHTFQESDFQRIRGKEIAMVFQEPMTALNPLHTIEKQIAEPIDTHEALTTKQVRTRVIELLNMVGFPEAKDRLRAFPHQLSGGQRQRVMIAMALACQPKVLIADEPTTALDVTIQAGIIRLLRQLQHDLKMGLILITHDLGMVKKFSDGKETKMGVMQEGSLVELNSIDHIFNTPKHAYTKKLIDSEPQGHPKEIPSDAKDILKAQHIKVTFGRKKGFWRPFDSETHAVKDISFHIKEGETIGIVGESGSGKSTLGYALLRLLNTSYTGKIVYQGQDLMTLAIKHMRSLRKDLQIIFQDPFSSLNPRFTCAQSIGEGLKVHESTLSKQDIEDRVLKSLKEVGLDASFMHRYPHELSGGQRQRIAIARALILRPRLIVLDEPTSALDRSIQGEVIELLRVIQAKYKLSYLFISHDLKVVRAMSHRIMVMRNGKIIEMDTAEEVFLRPKDPYTQELLRAAI